MKKNLFSISSGILFLLFLNLNSAFAQWETHGPYGGAMTALTSNSSYAFVGTMANGVFRSSDNGATWTAANTGLERTAIIDVATNASGVFAGTAEKGVYFSSDNGTTWMPRNNGLMNMNITSLFTAGTGLYAGTPDGVFYSSDNGLTWTLRNSGIPSTYYIVTWAAMGDSLYAGTLGQGMYLSNNNGMSWAQVSSGFPAPGPTTSFYVYALSSSGNTIYAGTSGGFYLSTNRGATWANSGNMFMQTTFAQALAVKGGTIFAGTYGNGIFYSTDNGSSWITANNGLQSWPSFPNYPRVSDLMSSGNAVMAATYFGMYRSINDGQTWMDANQGILATDITGVATNGTVTFAATNLAGMYATTDKGMTWMRTNNGLQAENIRAVVTQDNYAFASVMNKKVSKSNDNGASWTYASNGLPADVEIFEADTDRVLAITVAGMFTPNKLYQTTDKGSSWAEIPTTPGGGGFTAIGVRYPYIYLGTSQGNLLRTSNGGMGWGDISYYLPMATITSILPLDTVTYVGTAGKGIFMLLKNDSYMVPSIIGLTNYYITDIIYQDKVLFASINGGGVFVSSNGGASWSAFNGGLNNPFVRQLAGESMKVYAATDAGVYQTAEDAFKTIAILAGVEKRSFESGISFYPNPGNGLVNVTSSAPADVNIEISDITGKIIYNYKGKISEQENIDLRSQPRGIYFLKVSSDKGQETRKLVIQ